MADPAVVVGLLLVAVAIAGGALLLRHERARSLARARVEALDGEGEGQATARRGPASAIALPAWIPLPVAAVVGAAFAAWTTDAFLLSGVVVLAGVLAHIAIRSFDQSRALALEEGLAEAIGLATSSLRVGASPIEALERASQAIRGPARPVLTALTGRLRLGQAPEKALAELYEDIPLESFRLFSVALAVQWRAGGSLERSLGTVARALRDRVELLRRIRTQSAPTRGSVFAFVAATGGIALLMWQNDPANLERFLASGTGGALVGLSVWLQAIGILWMWRLSQIRA